MSQITQLAAGQDVQSSIEPGPVHGDEKKFENTDVGVTVLNGIVDELSYDSAEARKVVWKIDLFLLPLLAVTYVIQVSFDLSSLHFRLRAKYFSTVPRQVLRLLCRALGHADRCPSRR